MCSSDLMADRSHDQTAMEVRLTLEGARPMDLAVKQLSKLYDVLNVQVQQIGRASCRERV